MIKHKQIALIGITIVIGLFFGIKIWNMEPVKIASGHDHHHGDEEHHEVHGKHPEDKDHEAEQLELSEEALKKSEIEFSIAGPQQISKTLTLHGTVIPNQNNLARVSPRFPGIIKKMYKNLGDYVRKGDTLAIVESNESLSPYPLLAYIGGIIIEKNSTLGEFAETHDHLYTIVNLHTVWIEFNVHRDDFAMLSKGQKVSIYLDDNSEPQYGKLDYLSPVGNEGTQSVVARASISNPNKNWTLGLYVYGKISIGTREVKVAVLRNAIQTVENKKSLFVKEEGKIEIRQVHIGKEGLEFVEILSGIEAGERYASENSFILKAEHGKSEATHEH